MIGVSRLVPRGIYARNVFILAGGTAASQLLYLVGLPILTRLFSAVEFGHLSLFQSILGILVAVSGLRYEMAIVIPEDDETAANVLALTLAVLLCTCVATTIGLLIILHTRITLAMSWAGVFQSFWWLIPIGQFKEGIYQVISFWAIRRKHFKQISKSKFSQVICQLVCQVSLGLLKFSTAGLLIGDVVGRSCGGTAMLRQMWVQDKDIFKKVSWLGMSRAAVRFKDFPLLATGANLLSIVSLQAPVIIIASLFGAIPAGWYALTTRIGQAPSLLISKSISQVYMAEVSQLARDNPLALKRIFLVTARRLFCLGIGPCIFLFAFGPFLFKLLFGEKWFEAGVIARYMSILFLANFVIFPLVPTLNILERQKWQFAWDGARISVMIFGFWLCHYLKQSALQAILFYAIAMTITLCIHFLLCHVRISQLVRFAALPGHPQK